ncbi:MAG: substrate-binding domain-containing protein [Nitrospira sp. BO4]|nr:substrate-binding domain-containing protein [Nitrospira sp. BO4]
MIRRFLKMLSLAFAVQSALHLVYLAEHASAELSDPFVDVNVNSTSGPYSPKKQVSGAFKIQSSEALHALLTRLSMDFQRVQPKVNIEVKKGSSKAVAEFLQPPLSKTGKILMVDDRASSFQLLATLHQLSEAEVKEFVTQHGYEPTVTPIAVDAVALYVHKDNPLQGLTLDQVDALFSSTRKRGAKTAISQWGQLGLTDGWKDAAIQLYGREKQSEARATFQEHGLGGGEFKSGIEEHPGAASVALNVHHHPQGIGYSALGLHASNVRALPIAEKEGMPFVSPSHETVVNQTYPLQHALYLYFDKSPKAPLPDAVQEFLTFIMSQEGETTVVKAGLFPVPTGHAENRAIALGGGRSPSANP